MEIIYLLWEGLHAQEALSSFTSIFKQILTPFNSFAPAHRVFTGEGGPRPGPEIISPNKSTPCTEDHINQSYYF